MLNDLDYAIETFDLAELKSAALALINGSAIELDDRLSWLREFDAEELQEMLDDIRDRGSVDGEDEVFDDWSGVSDRMMSSLDAIPDPLE